MAKNDFQYGGWNYYTLQCGMRLWNHDSEFAKWQHVPCNVIRGSGMTCHGIPPNVRSIGILHLVSISTISPQSTCHSAPVCEILSKSDHPVPTAEKNDVMSIFKMAETAILDFRGPVMGSLKSPCTTSYRSSVETIALNCFVFEKIAFLQFGDRQTNRWTGLSHEAALAVASGGLILFIFEIILQPRHSPITYQIE